METLDTITELQSSPDLIAKLKKHSLQKQYNQGEIILNEKIEKGRLNVT